MQKKRPSNSFVEFVIDQIQDAGIVACKSMFGGYTVYCNERIVALVCDNQLFVKPTINGRKWIGNVKEAPPYPGAKPCFLIENEIEDKKWISELIKITAEELPEYKPKKKKRKFYTDNK